MKKVLEGQPQGREAALAEALRANLRRRKALTRPEVKPGAPEPPNPDDLSEAESPR